METIISIIIIINYYNSSDIINRGSDPGRFC